MHKLSLVAIMIGIVHLKSWEEKKGRLRSIYGSTAPISKRHNPRMLLRRVMNIPKKNIIMQIGSHVFQMPKD